MPDDTMQAPPDDDCFAIRQAARFVSQIYSRHMEPIGLRIQQYSMLVRLSNGGSMTMQELADAMVMDRTTLVRASQPLRREGLIACDAVGGAGRVKALSLTEAGKARVIEGRKHWLAAQEEFEQRFGVERAAALRRELLSLTHD